MNPRIFVAELKRASARRIRHVIWFIAVALCASADATEGLIATKPPGVDTQYAGMMPPPGLHITNFLGYYHADRVLDSSGDDRINISNYDIRVISETLRFRYIWPGVTFLGANIETRFGYNIVTDVRFGFDLRTPRGVIRRYDDTRNTGDSHFALALGWHGKRFHQMIGTLVFIPTGDFSATQLANTGRGYWSLGPSYWFTWFPIEQLEVSGALLYTFNFENPDTRFHSGSELSLDYNIGYSVTRDLQIGASGAIYKQIQDDELHDQRFGDGNRGQVFSVGPMLHWHRHNARWGVVFKWQHEVAVRNRPKGERFFLQAAVQF
jgi:hypothetical protein